MTFLSGFAEGFTSARKDRLDRDAQKEDTQFRYGMDALVKQREKRDAKKLKETELSKQAQELARQANDPNFAGVAYNEMTNGVDYTEMQKRVGSSYYKKNDKWVAPTQTVKIPAGVVDEYEQYDADMGLDPKVAARIDEIDPTLRKGRAEPAGTSTDIEGTKDAYVYAPTNELKIGDFSESILKQKRAYESGDPAQMKAADMELQAQKDAIVFREVEKAKAEKRAPQTYGIIGSDGVLKDVIVGEVGEDSSRNPVMYNVGNPLQKSIVELGQGGRIVPMSEDLNKKRYAIAAKYQEQKTKYDESQTSFNEGIQATGMIKEIMHRNPGVTRQISGLASIAESLQGNIRAGVEMLASQQAEVEASMASGNPDDIAKTMMDYEKGLQDFATQATDKSWLSEGNQQLEVDRAMFQALQKKLVYSLAAANGVRGTGQSKSDLANFEKMIGQGGSPEAIEANIDNMNMLVLTKLRGEEDALAKNEEVKAFEMELSAGGPQVKSPFSPRRTGDLLQEMDPSGSLRSYYDMLYNKSRQGSSNAAAQAVGGDVSKGQPVPVEQTGPKVGTIEDGYEFVGGNPADSKSWKKVNK